MTLASPRSRFAMVAALALCGVGQGHGWAQPAPPVDRHPDRRPDRRPDPRPDPRTDPPPDPRARSPDDAPIAPPAPDASPAKAKQAAATARAAALTPIVPGLPGARPAAFQLYAEIDLPVLAVGVVFVAARFARTQKAFCAPLCDRNDLNSFDRSTAGFWSPAWTNASNVGLLALGTGVEVLLTLEGGVAEALNDSVVIAEAAMSATAAASIMTLAAGRPRPFLYGTKAPLSERNGSDAGNSFLSSHAAVAFAIATSTYIAAHRLNPRSALPYWVLGLGLSAGSFIATARVMAGQHFVTDAVGGAVVGSAVGVLVSSIHPSPVTIVPVADERSHGIGIQGRF
jgi:membrane-associated phospholipid phosphatase